MTHPKLTVPKKFATKTKAIEWLEKNLDFSKTTKKAVKKVSPVVKAGRVTTGVARRLQMVALIKKKTQTVDTLAEALGVTPKRVRNDIHALKNTKGITTFIPAGMILNIKKIGRINYFNIKKA